MSPKFSLDKEDAKAILRTAAIIYAPVALLALDQIQAGKFDVSLLYAAAVSVTIDIVRRWIKSNTPSSTK